MRVIPALFTANDGFGVSHGWELKIWEAELSLPEVKGGPPVSRLHRVFYLVHLQTGHIITSQQKAWNDQVRMRNLTEKLLLLRDG